MIFRKKKKRISECRVLIIDNDETSKLTYLYLDAYGFKNITVSRQIYNSKNAQYDVVILNDIINHKNINYTFNIIKESFNSPETSFLALLSSTSYSKEYLNQLGISNYLLRPINSTSFCDAVKRVWNGEQIYDDLPEQYQQLFYKVQKKILVVEDDEINQLVIEQALQIINAKIDYASNGKEAIDLIEQNNYYDLIIMDLNMPVLNGYDATKEIRNAGHAMPIIALSSDSSDSIREKVKEVGMNAFFTKPINTDSLLHIIRKLIEKE